MKSDVLLNHANLLNRDIKDFLKVVSYDKYSCLDMVETNSLNDELIKSELERVAEQLDNIRIRLNYLNRPITVEGVLKCDVNGRYSLGDFEYSCASSIEFLFVDEEDDSSQWIISSVEGNEDGYYIKGYKKVKMEGLTVRRREIEGLYNF